MLKYASALLHIIGIEKQQPDSLSWNWKDIVQACLMLMATTVKAIHRGFNGYFLLLGSTFLSLTVFLSPWRHNWAETISEKNNNIEWKYFSPPPDRHGLCPLPQPLWPNNVRASVVESVCIQFRAYCFNSYSSPALPWTQGLCTIGSQNTEESRLMTRFAHCHFWVAKQTVSLWIPLEKNLWILR